MTSAGINGAAHGVAGRGSVVGRVEKAKVIVPRNIHEDLEFVLRGEIQEPLGGDMINTNEISAQLADLPKITRRLFRRGIGLTRLVRRQGAVRDSFHIKFLLTEPEKFSVHAHAQTRRSLCHPLWTGAMLLFIIFHFERMV